MENKEEKKEMEVGDISTEKSGERRDSRRRDAKIFGGIVGFLTACAVICLIVLPNLLYKNGARDGMDKSETITIISIVYLLLVIAVTAVFVPRFTEKESERRVFTTQNITRTAVFSALSIVLYYFVKFPLPWIFPSFLDIQFSDLPALLAGYMMGPLAGSVVIVIRTLVKLPASGTYYVGELVDLIVGLAFVIPSSVIYRKFRNKKGAAISLVAGAAFCVAIAAITNRFIAIPAYVKLMFSGEWDYLINAMNAIFSGKVDRDNFYVYYIFLSVIPFNILRCSVTGVLTFFSYKRLKNVFDRMSAVRNRR